MHDLRGWSAMLDQTSAVHEGRARRICEMCVPALAVSGGGISMVTHSGVREIVCSTDETSAHIEDLQFTLGEGPCVEVIRIGATVLIPDLSDRADARVRRWASFSESAVARGVGSVFAFPLRVGSANVGAMDLYRDAPGGLSPHELAGALLAADAATVALLRGELGTAGDPADTTGMEGTHCLQVHQATGMVKAQLGTTIENALSIVRARAFSTGLAVEEIAREIVERRLRFTREDE
jgi:hypothetical protein